MLAVALAVTGIQSKGSHPPHRSTTVKMSAEDTEVTRIVKTSIKASLNTEDLEDTSPFKEEKGEKKQEEQRSGESPVRCRQVL